MTAISFAERACQIARDRDKKNHAKLNTTVAVVFSSPTPFASNCETAMQDVMLQANTRSLAMSRTLFCTPHGTPMRALFTCFAIIFAYSHDNGYIYATHVLKTPLVSHSLYFFYLLYFLPFFFSVPLNFKTYLPFPKILKLS